MKTIVRLQQNVDENNFPHTYVMDDESADALIEKGWYREITEDDMKPNPWCCMTTAPIGQAVTSMVMVPPSEVESQEAVGLRKLTEEEFAILTINLQLFIERRLSDKRKQDAAIGDVIIELNSAVRQFGSIKSLHEAYGVIAEEFREFEEHVFMNAQKRDLMKTRNELKQLGAMAIRTMMDCC